MSGNGRRALYHCATRNAPFSLPHSINKIFSLKYLARKNILHTEFLEIRNFGVSNGDTCHLTVILQWCPAGMANTGQNAYFVLDTSGVASTESHVLFPWSKAAAGFLASGHRIRALDTGATGLCPQLIMIIFIAFSKFQV